MTIQLLVDGYARGIHLGHAFNAATMSFTTANQFLGVGWRKSRIVGYQGLSSRSRNQRQSAKYSSANQTGTPKAPARCATAVSQQMTRSNDFISAAVSTNAPDRTSSSEEKSTTRAPKPGSPAQDSLCKLTNVIPSRRNISSKYCGGIERYLSRRLRGLPCQQMPTCRPACAPSR